MPKIQEITVTYRLGIRRNIEKFTSAIIEIEESEKWDVSDLDELAVELHTTSVYDRLRAKIDKRVEEQDQEWQG